MNWIGYKTVTFGVLFLFLTMFNNIVGAVAASRYGSSSDQMMRLLAAPAQQHWFVPNTFWNQLGNTFYIFHQMLFNSHYFNEYYGSFLKPIKGISSTLNGWHFLLDKFTMYSMRLLHDGTPEYLVAFCDVVTVIMKRGGVVVPLNSCMLKICKLNRC
jgi:hypothetical protein